MVFNLNYSRIIREVCKNKRGKERGGEEKNTRYTKKLIGASTTVGGINERKERGEEEGGKKHRG